MRISDWSSDVCSSDLLLAAELPTGYGYWRPWRRAPETRRQLHPHCLWIAVTSPALPVSVRSKSTLSPTLAASVIAGAALNAIVIAGHLASGIGPWSSVIVPAVLRSEERRVGQEWVSTCSSRWLPDH